MKLLANFRESIVTIWSICMVSILALEFQSKPQKPINGSRVVYSCKISEGTKRIEWLRYGNSTCFGCKAPFSAGMCQINCTNLKYDFDVKESNGQLISSITIRNYSSSEDKTWACKDDNEIGNYSTIMNGKETDQTKIEILPKKNTYDEGEDLNVTCRNETENLYILDKGKKGERLNNGTVKVECRHTGFQCSGGDEDLSRRINVKCPVQVLDSSGDVTAAVGDDVNFIIDIIGYPVNRDIVKWYKLDNGVLIPIKDYRNHKSVNKTKLVLTIYDVQAIDAGTYQAQIKPTSGNVIMKEFKLNVKDNSAAILGFGAGIGIGIIVGFLIGSAIIVGSWFTWRWKKSKGGTYQQEEYENVEYKNKS